MLLQCTCQPVQSLIKSIPSEGTCPLYMPFSVPKVIETKAITNFHWSHCPFLNGSQGYKIDNERLIDIGQTNRYINQYRTLTCHYVEFEKKSFYDTNINIVTTNLSWCSHFTFLDTLISYVYFTKVSYISMRG